MEQKILTSVLVVVLALGSAEALLCWGGSQFGSYPTTCLNDAKFCVLWHDYTFDDYYGFCDQSGTCTAEGFTNHTYYGVNCCSSDFCNIIPTPAPGNPTPTFNTVTPGDDSTVTQTFEYTTTPASTPNDDPNWTTEQSFLQKLGLA